MQDHDPAIEALPWKKLAGGSGILIFRCDDQEIPGIQGGVVRISDKTKRLCEFRLAQVK